MSLTSQSQPPASVVASRRQSRLLAILAYVGILLFVLGVIERAYIPPFVVGIGFLLIIVGGVGLLALTRRERLRPTGAVKPSPLPGFGVPLDLAPPPPDSLLQEVDLTRTVSVDLSTEYRTYKRSMRFPVFARVGMYLFLIGVAGWGLAEGILRRDPILIGFGIAFIALSGWLFSVLRSVNRGVTGMIVGPAGIEFALDGPAKVLMRWEDPQFGLKVTERSAESNRQGDPPRDTTTYRLFTGPGSGVGRPPRILTEVPAECVTLVMAFARARQLRVIPGVEGAPGTVSARRTYRILAPATRS